MAQLSHVSCYLLSWRSQGVLLASQGGPDCADIWRTGPRWPVGLFCAAAVTATVHLRFAPLSLSPFCLSRFSLWLSHLSSLCHFSLCFYFLYSALILFHLCLIFTSSPLLLSFFPLHPLAFLFFFSHVQALCHSASLPHTYSLSTFHPLPPSLSVGSLC